MITYTYICPLKVSILVDVDFWLKLLQMTDIATMIFATSPKNIVYFLINVYKSAGFERMQIILHYDGRSATWSK